MTPICEVIETLIDPQQAENRRALEVEIERNNLLSRRLTLLRNCEEETERKRAASEERIRHLKARLSDSPLNDSPFPAGGIAYEEREQ